MSVNNFFFTQVKKSIVFSKQRLIIVLISIFIGTCVTNAFLNIYFDIDNKMSKELKSYGANMLISSKSDDYLDIKEANLIKSKISKDKLLAYSPHLYFSPVFSTRQLIVAGVDFDEFKKINKFLLVKKGSLSQSEYSKDNSIYLGIDLANTLKKDINQKLPLTIVKNGIPYEKTYIIKGIFSTGDEIAAMGFINFYSANDLSGINVVSYTYLTLLTTFYVDSSAYRTFACASLFKCA
ncbi:hypothetical protein [Campylobacter sp. 2018MI27]|uniref:hypothetical protein n=1 Tax=Campylobacter sp. 2018MI27 TaxID=2836738 RepID=UPI001BDA5978|nr:hypothetical protein [Campylobacter sp. 2018MI27]MBT0881431.1 hypothetical protein [Campylobacter sp. 2018MI27]